jgi:hypothetical protein
VIASRLLLAAALVLLLVAVWTSATGQIRWRVDGLVLRNSSIVRPVVIAAVLLCLAGTRAIRQAAALAAVAVILPVSAYALQVEHLFSAGSPLQVLRDCAASVPAARRETRVYALYPELLNHYFYYYLRHNGPWLESDRPDEEDLHRRLFSPGEQTLVVMTMDDYDAFLLRSGSRPRGVAFPEDVVVLTPGPFAVCGEAALAAGGTEIGLPYPPRARH